MQFLREGKLRGRGADNVQILNKGVGDEKLEHGFEFDFEGPLEMIFLIFIRSC